MHGCDRTGFDTLAAGPSRSFAIHAFPNYTNAPWPAKGLSILDFGVVYKGYTSDTTLTVAKGKLTAEQKKQLDLVQKAYNECLKLYTPEHTIHEASKRADYIFSQAKRALHSGHRMNTPAEVKNMHGAHTPFRFRSHLNLMSSAYAAKNFPPQILNHRIVTATKSSLIPQRV